MTADGSITSVLLENAGILHAFLVDSSAHGLPPAWRDVRMATQVHGADTCIAHATDAPGIAPDKADAIIARQSGLRVGVRTADCVPVLLANSRAGAVAAVHAGWRGVVAGVIDAAWDAMGGADIAAVGPHIQSCCFETSDDIAHQIANASCEGALVMRHAPDRSGADGETRTEKAMVDLGVAVRAQLQRRGLDTTRIEALGHCTKCDTRFPSYRRSGANAGRMISAIAAFPARA